MIRGKQFEGVLFDSGAVRSPRIFTEVDKAHNVPLLV
jgi:hypothetical protein